MSRAFVPLGKKIPPFPPGFKFPVWISHGDPPKPPRKGSERERIIGLLDPPGSGD